MLTPLFVPPVLRQHAADAAFYWSLAEYSAFSPTIGQAQLAHFHHLLVAHLDGLRYGGEVGWAQALENLETWQTEGEAFVAAWLAFGSGDERRVAALSPLLENMAPEIACVGVVAALNQCASAAYESRLSAWLNAAHPLWQAVAAGIYAAKRLPLDDDMLYRWFDSDSAPVRAAACRYLGGVSLPQWNAHLHHVCQDESFRVRRDAILALFTAGGVPGTLFSLASQALQTCLDASQPADMDEPEWQRLIELLTRLAGHLAPADTQRVDAALRRLPDYLQILFLAHHGSPQYLPLLLRLMRQDALAPLSWWAVCLITGLDIEDESYLTFNQAESEDENAEPDLDEINAHLAQLVGELYLPAPDAVARYVDAWRPPANKLLLGMPVTPDACRQILADADASMLTSLCARWHLLTLNRPHNQTLYAS